MKQQGTQVASEISEFRKQCDELLKLVDTFKEDNTRKLYNMFVNERERKQIQQK